VIDIILATDDLKEFHKENLAMNRPDYTVAARITKCSIIHFFQRRGAKVHYNIMQYKIPETEEEIKIRYGIIDRATLHRDLKYWETLCVSSVMQRPHLILNPHDETVERQVKNLKSAFAFAALVAENGDSEHEFYENIVEIPHYESKYLSLLDREDSIKVVA
jgi:hypothetical protein